LGTSQEPAPHTQLCKREQQDVQLEEKKKLTGGSTTNFSIKSLCILWESIKTINCQLSRTTMAFGGQIF
jgi:hypothetical protein